MQRHRHLLHTLDGGNGSLYVLGTMAAIHPLYIIYNIGRHLLCFFPMMMVVMVVAVQKRIQQEHD